MDQTRRGGRQNEHSVHQTSRSRYPPHVPASQDVSVAGSTAERFRPSPLNLSTSTPRSMGAGGNYNNYYQESPSTFSASTMSSSMLAYGADYGSDTRNQTSGMGSYNAGMMMYNVPHTAAQQSVYDTQQFTPRQHAAMQMMPSDVASTYFAGSEGATNTGSSSLQTSAQNSSSSPSVYQQHNPGLSYSSNMSGSNNNNNHNHSSSSSSEMHHQAGSSHHQQQQQAPATTASAGAAADNREFPNDDTTAEKWSSFQRQLGALFQEISNGQLERAAEALLSISTWMLSQVVELGLHQDNQALHEDRLRVWNDFNHAWLALAFQQKELMASGRQVSRSQRLMSEEAVKKLGDELIRLCDGIERHGLVDYQYGVWEEQIEAVLEECLDLFENTEASPR